MNALLWFFIIVFGISLFFRVAGPWIIRPMLKWLNKKTRQNLDEQSRMYQRHAENNSPYEDNYFFGDDVKVSVPKNQPRQKKDKTKSATEVEYEDLD